MIPMPLSIPSIVFKEEKRREGREFFSSTPYICNSSVNLPSLMRTHKYGDSNFQHIQRISIASFSLKMAKIIFSTMPRIFSFRINFKGKKKIMSNKLTSMSRTNLILKQYSAHFFRIFLIKDGKTIIFCKFSLHISSIFPSNHVIFKKKKILKETHANLASILCIFRSHSSYIGIRRYDSYASFHLSSLKRKKEDKEGNSSLQGLTNATPLSISHH